jgi:hypothetical protein
MDVVAATWIGVAMSALALGGTIANNIVSYFKDRDKLKYDAKVIVLEEHFRECVDDHKNTKFRLDECLEQHRSSDIRLSALEAKVK